MIAAVGSDGMRPVVWGIGRTARAALRDAARQEDAPGEDDLETHEVSARVVAAVRAGTVDWETLRRMARTQPESERRAVQVLVRLTPDVRGRLDALAEEWDTSRSDAVARLVTGHDARR